MKKLPRSRYFWVVAISILSLAFLAYAADIEMTLPAGAWALSIKNSGGTEVARIDSAGDIQADGDLSIDGTTDSYIAGSTSIIRMATWPRSLWRRTANWRLR